MRSSGAFSANPLRQQLIYSFTLSFSTVAVSKILKRTASKPIPLRRKLLAIWTIKARCTLCIFMKLCKSSWTILAYPNARQMLCGTFQSSLVAVVKIVRTSSGILSYASYAWLLSASTSSEWLLRQDIEPKLSLNDFWKASSAFQRLKLDRFVMILFTTYSSISAVQNPISEKALISQVHLSLFPIFQGISWRNWAVKNRSMTRFPKWAIATVISLLTISTIISRSLCLYFSGGIAMISAKSASSSERWASVRTFFISAERCSLRMSERILCSLLESSHIGIIIWRAQPLRYI